MHARMRASEKRGRRTGVRRQERKRGGKEGGERGWVGNTHPKEWKGVPSEKGGGRTGCMFALGLVAWAWLAIVKS